MERNKQAHYFFTDEEFTKRKITGEITRFKGLGQMSAKDTKESMFDLKNQRFEVLKPSAKALATLEQLMGEDVAPRKEFVFANIDFSKMQV